MVRCIPKKSGAVFRTTPFFHCRLGQAADVSIFCEAMSAHWTRNATANPTNQA
jgi:hypothetical protein